MIRFSKYLMICKRDLKYWSFHGKQLCSSAHAKVKYIGYIYIQRNQTFSQWIRYACLNKCNYTQMDVTSQTYTKQMQVLVGVEQHQLLQPLGLYEQQQHHHLFASLTPFSSFLAVLESASLEKIIPESPQSSEAGDMSPCRSPSTPRHLRYRQPGGNKLCVFVWHMTHN